MKTTKFMYLIIITVILMSFYACATIPEEAEAAEPFNKEKYLGKWYEIARLDFRFEKNLNNTTAAYTLNENGTIKVQNEGYNN
jgi:apolipoprotein D and lipocalin family protein